MKVSKICMFSLLSSQLSSASRFVIPTPFTYKPKPEQMHYQRKTRDFLESSFPHIDFFDDFEENGDGIRKNYELARDLINAYHREPFEYQFGLVLTMIEQCPVGESAHKVMLSIFGDFFPNDFIGTDNYSLLAILGNSVMLMESKKHVNGVDNRSSCFSNLPFISPHTSTNSTNFKGKWHKTISIVGDTIQLSTPFNFELAIKQFSQLGVELNLGTSKSIVPLYNAPDNLAALTQIVIENSKCIERLEGGLLRIDDSQNLDSKEPIAIATLMIYNVFFRDRLGFDFDQDSLDTIKSTINNCRFDSEVNTTFLIALTLHNYELSFKYLESKNQNAPSLSSSLWGINYICGSM